MMRSTRAPSQCGAGYRMVIEEMDSRLRGNDGQGPQVANLRYRMGAVNTPDRQLGEYDVRRSAGACLRPGVEARVLNDEKYTCAFPMRGWVTIGQEKMDSRLRGNDGQGPQVANLRYRMGAVNTPGSQLRDNDVRRSAGACPPSGVEARVLNDEKYTCAFPMRGRVSNGQEKMDSRLRGNDGQGPQVANLRYQSNKAQMRNSDFLVTQKAS